MKPDTLLPELPSSLREELLTEFRTLITDFSESRWRASALGAGRFCEVAYSIIAGTATNEFPDTAARISDFRGSCRQLENKSALPKSFRYIMLPTLTALYEVRNNRNVGHVNSEIDPSFMDGSFVIAGAKWTMAEFIRHFHKMPTATAQSAVDSISQFVSPAVWSDEAVRRVLQTGLSLDTKILLLVAAAGGTATRSDLFDWLDEGSKRNFDRRIAALHDRRMIEAKAYGTTVKMLPPGNAYIASVGQSQASLAA